MFGRRYAPPVAPVGGLLRLAVSRRRTWTRGAGPAARPRAWRSRRGGGAPVPAGGRCGSSDSLEDLAPPHRVLDPALPLAAQRGAGALGLDQLLQLLQRDPEQVLQPQQLGEPLDVGLGVGAVGAGLAAAGRRQQPDLLVVADRPRGRRRPAWRRRRCAARCAAHGVASISSAIASSIAAAADRGAVGYGATLLARPQQRDPGAEHRDRGQHPERRVHVVDEGVELGAGQARGEAGEDLEEDRFRHRGGDDRQHEGDRDHGAGVLQHRPRAGGDPAALGRHRAHHRRRVGRVEHPRADPDQGQPEHRPASRRCRPAGSSSARGRRR